MNLPKGYLEFQRNCIRQIPNKLKGVELRAKNPTLQIEARWLLIQYGYDDFLDDDHYVFMMINDFAFLYFKISSGEYPESYYWSTRLKGSRENGDLLQLLKSFSN